MRITNMDLNLGPGRNLQQTDLSYILDETDILCYQNGLIDVPDGWCSDSLGALGVAWREHLGGSYEHRGVFGKWAQVVRFDGLRVISVDFPKRAFNLNVVASLVKKESKNFTGTIVVAGDWSELAREQFTYLRKNLPLEYDGRAGTGIFATPGTIAGDRTLAITYGKRAVVSWGVHVG